MWDLGMVGRGTWAGLELGKAGGVQSEALPTRCWTGFLEHGVLGPAGPASPMGVGNGWLWDAMRTAGPMQGHMRLFWN